MIKQQFTSVLDMLESVEQMNQLDPRIYQYHVTQSVTSNRYKDGLHAVLLERKNYIREQMKTFSDSLREDTVQGGRLTIPECNLSEDDQRDEDVESEIVCYNSNLERIKMGLNQEVNNMEQGLAHCRNEMDGVLRGQMIHRPIDQTDLNSSANAIDIKFANCRNRLHEIAQNSILTQWKRVEDSKKRRRNFPREAIKKLQDYYTCMNKYPSENDKLQLAAECEISVQQVSNWFGNKRIRDKRNEQLQHILQNAEFPHQYQQFEGAQQHPQAESSGFFDDHTNPLVTGANQFSSLYGTSLNSIDYI